jgi:uncharacterized damage-inducible protein DinB
MMLSTHYRAMARNNAWSNHRLLRACSGLSQEEFEAPRVSFFPSLQLTLNHILLVDWYYLDALEEGGRGLATFASDVACATVPDLAVAQRAADVRLVRHCDGLDDVALERVVTLDRGEHGLQAESVDAVLAHLFVHQVHHRGQAHAMLAGTRVAPPQLDEFFLAGDAPLREAELRELGL